MMIMNGVLTDGTITGAQCRMRAGMNSAAGSAPSSRSWPARSKAEKVNLNQGLADRCTKSFSTNTLYKNNSHFKNILFKVRHTEPF